MTTIANLTQLHPLQLARSFEEPLLQYPPSFSILLQVITWWWLQCQCNFHLCLLRQNLVQISSNMIWYCQPASQLKPPTRNLLTSLQLKLRLSIFNRTSWFNYLTLTVCGSPSSVRREEHSLNVIVIGCNLVWTMFQLIIVLKVIYCLLGFWGSWRSVSPPTCLGSWRCRLLGIWCLMEH